MFRQLPTDRKTQKIAYCALSAALIFVFSYIEAMLDFSFGVPGVKVGLSNTVIILSLCFFGFYYSLCITVLKILINALILSGFSSFVFTAAGSICGFFAMFIIKKIFCNRVSCVGISAAGGFFHISAQYFMSGLLLKTTAVYAMFPYAVMISLVTSVFIGIICNLIVERKSRENGLGDL